MNQEPVEQPPLASPQMPVAPAPEFQQAPSPSPVSKKSRKKRLLLIVGIIVLLVGIGFAAYEFLIKKSTNTPAQSTANSTAKVKHDNFFPRINEVAGYAEFGGAKWYATPSGVIKIKDSAEPQYFTHQEGVPSDYLTSLTVHKGSLWVGSQASTAVLNKDQTAFETKGDTALQNGQIFNDTIGQTLYLSTFKGMYRFNDQTDAWESLPNDGQSPANVTTFAFNKNFVVTTANHDPILVHIFNRKTNKWSFSPPAGIKDAVPSVFTIDDNLFIMGRSVGYENCDNAVKVTATSVYKLDAAGAWQPLAEFNKDTKRDELQLGQHIKDTSTSFYTMPCTNAPTIRYKVTFANNTLVLTKDQELKPGTSGFSGDDGEQQVLVDELMKVTGHYALTMPLAVDKSGNLIVGYSKKADRSSSSTLTGLAVLKGSDRAGRAELQVPDASSWDLPTPILCDGVLSYLFLGRQSYSVGGGEGYANGTWDGTKLMKVDGTKVTDFVDLKNDVAGAGFACSKGKITWLGKNTPMQLDTSTKAISTFGTKVPNTTSLQNNAVYPLENGDEWILIPQAEQKGEIKADLYYVDATAKKLNKLAVVSGNPDIASANEAYVWLATTVSVNGPAVHKVVTYAKSGTPAVSQEITTLLRIAAYSTNSALIFSDPDKDDIVFFNYDLGTLSVSGVKHSLNVKELTPVWQISNESGSASTVLDHANKRLWVVDGHFGSFPISYGAFEQ